MEGETIEKMIVTVDGLIFGLVEECAAADWICA